MENEIFSDDEIKKFVDHFCAEEFNQFAYVVIDKAFDRHSDEERIYFRERCLASIEGVISKIKIPKDAAEFEKSIDAANYAGQLLFTINKMIEDGEFVMSS